MLGDDVYRLIQRGDNEDDVNRVIGVGFPVDKPDFSGWTALHYAAHMGRTACLSTLLECGADVNARTSREGQTALFLAARGGHLPCVRVLHAYHRWAMSAAAAAEVSSDVVQGVDASGATEEEFGQWTPLHVAVDCEQVSCAHYLMTHSLVDINARDIYDRTALQLLMEKRSNPALAVWMVLHGALALSKPRAPPMWDPTMLNLAHAMNTFDATIKQHDVCFLVEGKRLHAERAVLCARSTFFACMFSSSMKEAVRGEVELESTYSAVFAMLEWMYTGRISTDDFDDILQLWQNSHMYDIEALQNYCQKRLLKLFEARSMRLSDHSAQETWNYALALFNATEGGSSVDSALKAICGIYMLGRLEVILKSYKGDPVALVGRLFAAVDRKPYDPASYPSLPEIEAEIAFFHKHKRFPSGPREIRRVLEMEERRKGKSLLWFEEATGEGIQGWRDALAQLRVLRRLEEDHLLFDGLELHRFFDLIGGTGMGGVAAVCLGRARMTIAQVEALVGELILAADELSGGADSWLSYASKFLVWGSRAAACKHLTQRVHEIIERHIGNRQPSSASLVGVMDDDRQLRMCAAHSAEDEEQSLTEDRPKVLIITNRRPESNQGDTRAQGTKELFLKFYGDSVDLHSGCWDVTPAVSLADAAVAVLASAAPGAFDSAALANLTPIGSGDGGKVDRLGTRGRDALLGEMQKVWPRWELKLLLSLGSDSGAAEIATSAPPSALSPSASRSFAGHATPHHGRDLWDRTRELLLEDDSNDGSSAPEKVATVLGVNMQSYLHDMAATNRPPRSTRTLLQQTIAGLLWMQSSPAVDLGDKAADEAGERFNLLRLQPPPLAHCEAESQSSLLLRALIARVKRSMRAMEETDEDKCDDDEEDGRAEDEDEEGGRSS